MASSLRYIVAQTLVVDPCTVLSPGYLVLDADAGVVISASGQRPVDFSPEHALVAEIVIPGLVDIHTHGLGGAADTVDHWASPEFTCAILPPLGTTCVLASLTFPEDAATRVPRIMAALRRAMSDRPSGHARVAGVHAEGPAVAHLGGLPCGCASDVSVEGFRVLVDAMLPELKVVTISPSVDARDGFARIRYLSSKGVLPALGHDKTATEEEILGAMRAAGDMPVHITHLYNVCTFHHRDPGLVNIGLASPFPALERYAGLLEPTIELIGDMAHVSELAIGMALAVKRRSHVAMVTDSISAPVPGRRALYAGRTIEVLPSGVGVVLAGTSTLAGSCLQLLSCLQKLVNVLRLPLAEAVAVCATSPAAIAKLQGVGRLAPGYFADALCLSSDLQLQQTIVGGRLAYSSNVAT